MLTGATSENRAPIPIALLMRGRADTTGLELLFKDRRLEIYTAEALTPAWVALAESIAGTVIVTDNNPLDALVYAVSGGIREPIVVLFSERFDGCVDALHNAGATLCMPFPLTPIEVNWIVQGLSSRRSVAHVDETLRLLLDPVRRTARYKGLSIPLTQREFEVLYCLSSNGGKPIPAHRIIDCVWGKPFVGKRRRQILDVYVFQLRRKLARLGLRDAIGTVRGLGYVLRTSKPITAWPQSSLPTE